MADATGAGTEPAPTRRERDPAPPGVPDLPAVPVQLATTRDPVTATIAGSRLCTASRKAAGFVRHVTLDLAGTPLAGAFRPGQSIGVLPPGTDDRGRPHAQRLYSVSTPSEGDRLDGHPSPAGALVATTVKRLIDEHHDTHRLVRGVCSNFLCDAQVGDTVRIAGPAGKRFLLPADPARHDYLFIATGTGIAPFRGMILDLVRQAPASRATLLMGVPYATDLLYHDELADLAGRHHAFRYITAVSRERQHDLDRRLYVHDRLETHRDELAALLASERTLIYICGIAGMELGVFRRLLEILPAEALDQYLRLDDAARADPAGWDRKAVGRSVRPTRRVFVEVY